MCRNQVFLIFAKVETRAKFQQKLLNRRVVGAHRSFQIFKQNTLLLENNRALSKFCMGFCITQLVLSNLNKNSP